MNGIFVTGTGTGVGKTFVSRALASALIGQKKNIVAIKPIETGCDPIARDAIALGAACGHAELAHMSDFYRAPLPLSPYAVTLETREPPPNLQKLVSAVNRIRAQYDFTIVESAGGIMVPLTENKTTLDFAGMLEMPVLLVAKDELGVLSYVLTAIEVARVRKINVGAVVLSRHSSNYRESNRMILKERLNMPVVAFAPCEDSDAALARAAELSGLMELIFASV